MGVYVQYGCGPSAPDGWTNFDVSPTLRLQRLPVVGGLFKLGGLPVFSDNVRYGDIVAGLPVDDNSVDGIYASHVLEHLAYDDFWMALRNTYRLLKPGGIFRLVVPDLESRARAYLARLGEGDVAANDWFLQNTYLGKQSRPRGPLEYLRYLFGNTAHLWMWDERSMCGALDKVGFTDIRRAAFNDCVDQQFRRVEAIERFRDDAIAVDECAIEARKPLSVTASVAAPRQPIAERAPIYSSASGPA